MPPQRIGVFKLEDTYPAEVASKTADGGWGFQSRLPPRRPARTRKYRSVEIDAATAAT